MHFFPLELRRLLQYFETLRNMVWKKGCPWSLISMEMWKDRCQRKWSLKNEKMVSQQGVFSSGFLLYKCLTVLCIFTALPHVGWHLFGCSYVFDHFCTFMFLFFYNINEVCGFMYTGSVLVHDGSCFGVFICYSYCILWFVCFSSEWFWTFLFCLSVACSQ